MGSTVRIVHFICYSLQYLCTFTLSHATRNSLTVCTHKVWMYIPFSIHTLVYILNTPITLIWRHSLCTTNAAKIISLPTRGARHRCTNRLRWLEDVHGKGNTLRHRCGNILHRLWSIWFFQETWLHHLPRSRSSHQNQQDWMPNKWTRIANCHPVLVRILR